MDVVCAYGTPVRQIWTVPVAQRNAAQATPGMPTASRLNAGLLGWNLFSLALLPVHKDALSKLGLGYIPSAMLCHTLRACDLALLPCHCAETYS
jgi:hypothetical protein